MGSHVQQTADRPLRSEKRKTEVYVGNLADCGIGETLFRDLFLIRHHRAHKDRQHA